MLLVFGLVALLWMTSALHHLHYAVVALLGICALLLSGVVTWEDVKAELGLGIKHRDVWERIAVVTDLDWLCRAFELFSWMVPGEIRLFGESEVEQAKRWLVN